jgi:drug/metabolite transporter (DMT)-like permease
MWGSAYMWIEIGLEGLEPTTVAFSRVLLALALLAAIPAARSGTFSNQDHIRVVLLGALWLALPLTLFPVAQQWVSSTVAGVLTGAQPLFAAAIAFVLLSRAPERHQILGLCLGFGGVVAMVLASTDGESENAALGTALVIAAVACYALSTNLAVPLQQRHGSLAVILRALVVAAALLAVPGVVGLAAAGASAASLAAMLPLGLASTALGYVAFTALVGRAGAARGAVAIYLVPLVAIALGLAVRGEHAAPGQLAGAGAILAGAILVGRSAHDRAGAV